MNCNFYVVSNEQTEPISGIFVDFDSTIWHFPFDDTNRHYQQYLAWLAEGNTPEPWEEPNGPQ